MTDIDKTVLRVRMKDARATLAAAARAEAAKTLAAGPFISLPVSQPILSGYLPIRDELDPRPLMAALEQRGARLCLPVMHGRTKPLTFRAWTHGDAMDTAEWGIQEPKSDKRTLLPDIMLVPLLAVDRAGNRLGYGAGHYDRTIAEVRRAKPVITIALAFDAQIIDAVPHMAYDVPLDWILTPSGLVRCQGAA